jgi:tetratricopeptide (TPR) repeat protein
MPSYLQAIALIEATYGDEHRYLVDPLSSLGNACARTGRAEEAGKHYARAVRIADRVELRSEAVAEALAGLADLAAAAGSLTQARGLYERAAETFDAALGRDAARGARPARRAGELAADAGDRDAAIRWFERVLTKKPGEDGVAGDEPVLASLGLARALAARGDRSARVCELAQAALRGLDEAEPRRADADELVRRVCG